MLYLGEKKLAKIATPDPFRVKASKSSGASASSSSTGQMVATIDLFMLRSL